MQQADWIDALLCTKHHRKAKRAVMTITEYSKNGKGGMRDSLMKWGTGQWNTYGQLPRKCCEKEEISKRIESESQEVCCGFPLVLLGWCLSFFTLLSHYVNNCHGQCSSPISDELRNPVQGTDPALPLERHSKAGSFLKQNNTAFCYASDLLHTIMYMIFLIFPEGK